MTRGAGLGRCCRTAWAETLLARTSPKNTPAKPRGIKLGRPFGMFVLRLMEYVLG